MTNCNEIIASPHAHLRGIPFCCLSNSSPDFKKQICCSQDVSESHLFRVVDVTFKNN